MEKSWEHYHSQREQALESLYGQWRDLENATVNLRNQGGDLTLNAYAITFENLRPLYEPAILAQDANASLPPRKQNVSKAKEEDNRLLVDFFAF